MTTDDLLRESSEKYWRRLACKAMALAERWIQDNEDRLELQHESDFESQLVIEYREAKRDAMVLR